MAGGDGAAWGPYASCRCRWRRASWVAPARRVGQRQDDALEDGQPAAGSGSRRGPGRWSRMVRGEDPVALRRTIGYVIQARGAIAASVGPPTNVAMVPRLLHWKPGDIEQRVDELLALVGLPPAEFRAPVSGSAVGRAAPAGRGWARAAGRRGRSWCCSTSLSGRLDIRSRGVALQGRAGADPTASLRADDAAGDPRHGRGADPGRPDRG